MAYFRKRGKSWTVEFYRDGKREISTFRTKAEASLWVAQREADLVGSRLPDHTLGDALERYGAEIAPSLGGAKWARDKIRNLAADPIAKIPLAKLTRQHFAQWRDARLAGPRLRGEGTIAPSTVNRELNLLRAVLSECLGDWGWLRDNPMAGLKRPANPKARTRRISQDEIDSVCAGLGYVGGVPVTQSQRVACMFLFAIETALRGGEIVRLQWRHVGPLAVHLPKTKNGDARDVALSVRARELLALLPRSGASVFDVTDAMRGALFCKGVRRAGLVDLHFHDSRAEAIWRLSKKLDVLELARMIGHRNIASLMHYYHVTADELAAKLG